MLNILPAKKKTQIQKEQLYATVRSASVLIITFFIIADVCIYGTKFLVEQWHDQLQADSTNITVAAEEQDQIESNLNSLTVTMNAITEIQKGYINPVAVVVPIFNAFPDGTTVEQLAIDISAQQIVANGVTENRESFVTLQEQLNATPVLTDVNFEVTSFTQKENIPFEFNAKIDYENLATN